MHPPSLLQNAVFSELKSAAEQLSDEKELFLQTLCSDGALVRYVAILHTTA